MAPLSLKIVQDEGVVTRKVKLDPNLSVAEATKIVKEKANLPPDAKGKIARITSRKDGRYAFVQLGHYRAPSFYVIKGYRTATLFLDDH